MRALFKKLVPKATFPNTQPLTTRGNLYFNALHTELMNGAPNTTTSNPHEDSSSPKITYKRRWLPAYGLLTLLYGSLGIWFFVHFFSLVSLVVGLVLGEVATSDVDGGYKPRGSASSSSLSRDVLGELLGLSLAAVGRLIALVNAARLALKPSLFFEQSRFALAAPFVCTALLGLALGVIQQGLLMQLMIISPETLYAGLLVIGEGARWVEWLIVPFEIVDSHQGARGTIQVISASEGTTTQITATQSPNTAQLDIASQKSLFHSIKEHMNRRFFPAKQSSLHDHTIATIGSVALPDTSTSNLLLLQQEGASRGEGGQAANVVTGRPENIILVREASAQV